MTLHHGELKKDYAYRRILEMIGSGRVTDGRFPSEPEFCKELNVSRVTLRAALKRLEQEGLITRSHYYGTRVSPERPMKKVLIAGISPHVRHSDRKALEIELIEEACRERHLPYDTFGLFFLQDSEKLAEKYSGIIFSGAAICGDEPFMKVIRQSRLPAVYCREDHVNTITREFPSVGVNMKRAWLAGIDYLVSLGFRRIMTLISDDKRSCQRLGFTRGTLAELFRKKGLNEAAGMVVNVRKHDFDGPLKERIGEVKPDAIYCYSDYYAIMIYNVLRSLGRRIPQDTVVLGFGCGSELTTPSLSSVSLVSPLFGTAAVSQLLSISENPKRKPLELELPFSIYTGQSTARIELDNLMNQSRSCVQSRMTAMEKTTGAAPSFGSGNIEVELKSGNRRQVKRKE